MTPSRQRLTFVITSLGLGGAQQQVRSLCGRFQERGWDVDVVSLLDTVIVPPAGDLPDGVRVDSLGMRRRLKDVTSLPRLVRHLRRRRPHVVHAHMVHANLLARFARVFARVPVLVCTAHSPFEGGPSIDLAYRLSDRLADVTTNVSAHAAHGFVERRAVPAARMRVVPNGVDVAQYGPRLTGAERAALRSELHIPSGRFAWLNAGRLAAEKDLGTLLRAFKHLLERSPDHHLVLAGDGSERAALERLADTLGLRGHVTFLGFRSDVVRLMRAFDAFVMSSAWEGLPIVLLEAGACRLPGVATDVGATREVLLDGVTGRVAPPGAPQALGEAMAALAAQTDAERSDMGEAARAHVEAQFALERVVMTWEQLYAEFLCKRSVSDEPPPATRGR